MSTYMYINHVWTNNFYEKCSNIDNAIPEKYEKLWRYAQTPLLVSKEVDRSKVVSGAPGSMGISRRGR